MKVLLAEKYEDKAIKIMNTLIDTRLEYVDGRLQLGGICGVAGVGGKDQRDGSLNYYFNEPVVYDDHKGVGPFIMAYSELMRLEK
jgi:unsaturated rhamnogalacturonyl hydrolase